MTADAELLQGAVTEVARLLAADGAMIYLVDEAGGELQFAYDAGITDPDARRLIRDLTLPIGVGMFGTAVASGRLTVTDDYPADKRFTHSPVADRIVDAAGMRSMAVAPLVSNGRAIGAMGAYSGRPAAFTEAQVALLRALADHAATAIANQRLMTQLAASEERYRKLVEGSPDVVWATDADGTFTFLSETVEQMSGRRADELLGQHWSSIVDAADRHAFEAGWRDAQRDVSDERRARFRIARQGGPQVIVELRGRERLVGGRSAGANGALRDITDLARLEEDLRRHAEELARLLDVQRTVGEIARGIAEVDDPGEILQQVVDASKRLLGSDGAHLTLMNDEGTDLIPMVMAGDTDAETRTWLRGQRFPVGGGINGLAAETGRAVWTDDYRADPRIPHDPDDDSPDRLGLGAVAVAPLRGARGEVIGTLAITYRQPRAVDLGEVALLEELAGQGAVAARNAGLYAQLRESVAGLQQQAGALARSADAQRTLAEIAAEISSIRDPAAVLRRTVEAAQRLLGGDLAIINRLHSAAGVLYDLSPEDLEPLPDAVEMPTGAGVAGAAITDRRVRWTGDYVEDSSFTHVPAADAWMRNRGFRSQISAPLPAEGGPMSALTVYAARADAFGEDDAQLLGALASHAAIVQTSAALYEEAQLAAEDLSRLVEAQRTLSAIATELAALRDPGDVLQRTVDEAHRLLGADSALINPLSTSGDTLDLAVAFAPRDRPLDDVTVTPGAGVSGTALAERRVVRTGDYLNDRSFAHGPELDAYVARREMASVMSAPLIADLEPMGTLTVQASRLGAFTEDDAQLLGALAAQAAVAITNARLLDQLRESERRYRHLVDHSPDLVWSVDAEGRFTYLGESLERMTGFRADELLGQSWQNLLGEASLPAAAAAWQSIRERPREELQFRVDLPMSGGGFMAAEVSMVGTVVDGRFDGAQGSIRDVRERERLERDLRRQTAAIAANEERANLARELHDSVTQALFSMGLTASALELLLDRDPDAARRKLTELRELQKDALAEMRTLIFELRPQALETDGLAQALRNHAAAVQGRTGLSVSVEVDHPERQPIDVEEALYRIAQEALHNVVKHANAGHARISLRRVRRAVTLAVEDDGIGFDPEHLPRGHLGLVGMRQRAERMGAELTISRLPGGGSSIRVVMPEQPAAASAK